MKILIILWLIFFISHSLLAAMSIKAFFEKTLKISPPQYRLLFNALAIVLLIVIVFQLIRTPSERVFERSNFTLGVGLSFVVASFWLLKWAFQDINLSSFLGFSASAESSGLVTTGLYKIVRHPLYFASTILLAGIFLMMPTWTIAVSVGFSIVYIIVGIEFEERKLRQIFGSSYDDYALGKKKFLPFIY
jgi:methanethiol S-methyltransferase